MAEAIFFSRKILAHCVKFSRRQYREDISPERGSKHVAGQDGRIRKLFSTLDDDDKAAFLKAFASVLAEQSWPASSPPSPEQANR